MSLFSVNDGGPPASGGGGGGTSLTSGQFLTFLQDAAATADGAAAIRNAILGNNVISEGERAGASQRLFEAEAGSVLNIAATEIGAAGMLFEFPQRLKHTPLAVRPMFNT